MLTRSTADPASDAGPAPTQAPPDPTSGGLDVTRLLYLLLLTVAATATVLRAAFGPVRDVDVWWHVLVGRELLAGASVTGVGADWTMAPVDAGSWVTTQPIAEIVLTWLYDTWGPQGLLMLRVVSSVAAVAVLLLTTVRGRSLRAAAWPAILALVMVAIATQERSQQLTYVLAPLVGWWVVRLLHEGRVPRWWVVVPLVAVWGNVHGGWVLLPMFLALAAVGRLLDHGLRDRPARSALLISVVAVAAAALSPAGIANVTSLVRIRSAAWLIAEWEAVQPWTWLALPLVLMVVLVVVAWARTPQRVPRGEVLVLVLALAFCFSAWRNVTPGLLLVAPVAVPAVARWLGEPERVESRPVTLRLVAAGAAAALVACVAAGAIAWRQDPVVSESVPTGLLEDIAAASAVAPQRVVPTYNLGGAVLLFGGGPGRVQAGIDGRTDLFGSDWIQHYMRDIVQAGEGWEPSFTAMRPTAVLLREDEKLGDVLAARGWVEVGRENSYVLMHAPGAPGWS